MKLNSVQLAAAERGGCRFSPASPVEVQRLSMQNRIFWHDGHPFTARSATGFQETAGTLLKLIAQHEHTATPSQDAPPVATPAATGTPLASPPPEPPSSQERSDQPSAKTVQVEKAGAGEPVEATATADNGPRDEAEPSAVEPVRRTARRRAAAPRTDPKVPAAAAEASSPVAAATSKGLLHAGGGRTISLALSIAAAQTAGTQIAGEDFVALVERVNRALLTL